MDILMYIYFPENRSKGRKTNIIVLRVYTCVIVFLGCIFLYIKPNVVIWGVFISVRQHLDRHCCLWKKNEELVLKKQKKKTKPVYLAVAPFAHETH